MGSFILPVLRPFLLVTRPHHQYDFNAETVGAPFSLVIVIEIGRFVTAGAQWRRKRGASLTLYPGAPAEGAALGRSFREN